MKVRKLRTDGKLPSDMPTVEQLERELRREKYKIRYRHVFKSTISLLAIAAAAAILVVTLWMPVLQIYGKSMSPNVTDGDIVVLMKNTDVKQGDLIAFYYNNKILVKRVIAFAGDWVDIKDDGTVYINDEVLDEPYLTEKALGECDLEFPYQVPDGKVFVMGDHRSVSVDSRSNQIGCVSEEQIIGKLKFRVWPIKKFGSLE
jgi:signal peptidase I